MAVRVIAFSRSFRYTPSTRALLGGSLAAAGLLLLNYALARGAERRHPPRGQFVDVGGVRLTCTDSGSGSPVVLIHGNLVSGEDWENSGVAPLLRRGHRVIVFDRPGFGHTTRPRNRIWTASAQAELIHLALGRLGVERPVVVGHSWGAAVAAALAARHPEDVGALALVSGYYFWTVRPDVLQSGIAAIPVVGDLVMHTLAPLLARLQLPLMKWQLFSPAPVPSGFRLGASDELSLRPSQLRATGVDGATMIPAALALRDEYAHFEMPVAIIAGGGDKIVWTRNAERLHKTISGSTLQIVPNGGHMVHHVAPELVAARIESLARRV